MTEICTLTLQCDDRPGLVADVAGFLAQQGGNITDAQQFNDKLTDRFFMRVEFEAADDSVDGLRTAFTNVAQKRGMEWSLRRRSERQKVLLLVSKFDHCLVDPIYRWRTGDLALDPAAHAAAGRTTAALDACARAVAAQPDALEAQEALVHLYLELGWRDLAVEKVGLLDRLSALGSDPLLRARVLRLAREVGGMAGPTAEDRTSPT